MTTEILYLIRIPIHGLIDHYGTFITKTQLYSCIRTVNPSNDRCRVTSISHGTPGYESRDRAELPSFDCSWDNFGHMSKFGQGWGAQNRKYVFTATFYKLALFNSMSSPIKSLGCCGISRREYTCGHTVKLVLRKSERFRKALTCIT